MKTFLTLLVLAFSAVVAPRPCFAMMEIMSVSKEKAKEMGIEIRAKANGPNEAWIELEFKAVGELKRFSRENFSYVSLEISEGGKLVVGYAALQETRTSSGGILVRFLASRAHLDKVNLMIVVGAGELGGGGYELRVKDFVELEKLR